jgi:hypothetical protein
MLENERLEEADRNTSLTSVACVKSKQLSEIRGEFDRTRSKCGSEAEEDK